jgi:hypothetical protein
MISQSLSTKPVYEFFELFVNYDSFSLTPFSGVYLHYKNYCAEIEQNAVSKIAFSRILFNYNFLPNEKQGLPKKVIKNKGVYIQNIALNFTQSDQQEQLSDFLATNFGRNPTDLGVPDAMTFSLNYLKEITTKFTKEIILLYPDIELGLLDSLIELHVQTFIKNVLLYRKHKRSST